MWYKDQSLPKNYIFPLETRPGKTIIPASTTIPAIDLSKASEQNLSDTVQQILEAEKEFGFFQIRISLICAIGCHKAHLCIKLPKQVLSTTGY